MIIAKVFLLFIYLLIFVLLGMEPFPEFIFLEGGDSELYGELKSNNIDTDKLWKFNPDQGNDPSGESYRNTEIHVDPEEFSNFSENDNLLTERLNVISDEFIQYSLSLRVEQSLEHNGLLEEQTQHMNNLIGTERAEMAQTKQEEHSAINQTYREKSKNVREENAQDLADLSTLHNEHYEMLGDVYTEKVNRAHRECLARFIEQNNRNN